MQLLETITEFAQANLGDREREALWMRGVSDEQIRHYRIGHLDAALPEEARESTEFMDWCWNGRKLDDVFVFPLTNILGQIKGIQIRHVDRERSGYHDYIPVGDEAVMFGLGQAAEHIWERESAFTVEGVFDLFPVQRHDPTVFAVLNPRVPKQLSDLLKRLVTDVWLGFDMDEAGRTGCGNFEKFNRKIKAHIINWPRLEMPNGKLSKDPNEVWELWGDERLGVFLKHLQNPDFQET